MSGPDLNRQPVWKVLYEAAVLEFHPDLVQQRIDQAKAAIEAEQKSTEGTGSDIEKERLKEALDALDTLANMRVSSR